MQQNWFYSGFSAELTIKCQFVCEKKNGSRKSDGQTTRPIINIGLQNMSTKPMNGFTFG